MNSLNKPRESLSTIYTRRAYWAMNNVYNGAFLNMLEETYIEPDRIDNIVAMFTEQDPAEVALLCLTREIIERAEKEQPNKKLNITWQSKNLYNKTQNEKQICGEETKAQPEVTNTEADQAVKQKLKRKPDDLVEKQQEKEPQEVPAMTQDEGKAVVSIAINKQMVIDNPLRKQEIEEKAEETALRDIEMNGKESRQDTTLEERERQKRRKQEVESEIDIVGIPLEQSMWAPSKRG